MFSMFSKCLAHLEFLSVPFSCSFHHNRALRSFSYIICPTWTCSSIYYTAVMTYFVFVTEQRLNFSGVPYNVKLYFIICKCLTNFSLARGKGNLIEHSFLLSNNHCGINNSSFFWLNLQKTSFMTWIGKPACKYLIFILFSSSLKFDSILLARRSSPVIVLRLYLKGILLLQWTGNF